MSSSSHAVVNINSQQQCTQLALPARQSFSLKEQRLSPPKKFCHKIEKRFGIRLERVFHEYNLPEDLGRYDLEKMLLNDHYRTNAGAQVVSRYFLGLLDGEFNFTVYYNIDCGEAIAPVREELLVLARRIVSLNNKELVELPVEAFSLATLHKFLWGCASSINLADISAYCIQSPEEFKTEKGCKEFLRLKAEIQNQTGVFWGWHPSPDTLYSILKQLEPHSERIQASIVDRAKLATLKFIDNHML